MLIAQLYARVGVRIQLNAALGQNPSVRARRRAVGPTIINQYYVSGVGSVLHSALSLLHSALLPHYM